MEQFYTFEADDINGKKISMSEYEGKLVLVVNTASKCGFTKQYAGLEKLYLDYKDRGLVILAFPCNQFGGQEPGEAEEIKTFCQINFGVTFPLFQKIKVNGKEAHPLFQYLKGALHGLLGERIKWNFTKFIIDRTGKPVKRFEPMETPESIERYIVSHGLIEA
jgi:glutathione peroxidase